MLLFRCDVIAPAARLNHALMDTCILWSMLLYRYAQAIAWCLCRPLTARANHECHELSAELHALAHSSVSSVQLFWLQ